MKKIWFKLPPKGALEPNSADDPYPYYYHPLVSLLYRSRIEQALSLLTPSYESILEIGYGSGIMMPTLFCIGKKVSGIDIKSDPVRVTSNLKKLGVYVSLASGDILSANYPEGNFDLIVALSIFEHIRDLEPVINKVSCLLRPKGHLLVGMPRVDNFMRMGFSLIGYQHINDYHITNYRQFLRVSDKLFSLSKFIKIPSWGPLFIGLYFNMLLRKR